MAEKILINDDRLTADLDRIRSGSTQEFYKKGLKRGDLVLALDPPRKELYAELIDGKWYWVNGCAECNGKPRDWMTYIECEKHNVCRICGAKYADLKEPPWGGKHGWQCVPCANREKEEQKRTALKAVAAKEYDEWDYHGTDDVVCPHCGSSYEPDCEIPEGKETCEVCGGEYTVEPEFTTTYTTQVIGERITE